MNNKSKLKIMATSLALSAVSSGAWGVSLVPQVDASGIVSWGTSLIKVAPGFGIGTLPLDGAILTAKTHTFSRGNEILAAITLKEATPERAFGVLHGNPWKARGIFGRGQLPFPNMIEPEDDIQVTLLVQPFPDPKTDIYVRPEYAFFPNNDIGERDVTMTFGYIIPERQEGGRRIDAITQPPQQVTIKLNNQNFCQQAPEELKLPAANFTNEHAASVVSFFKIGKRVVYTYHVLVSQAIAQRMREHARFYTLYQMGIDYFGSFSNIYKTDGGATAAFAANLTQLHKDINPGADLAVADIQNLWKQISENNDGASVFRDKAMRCSGPLVFINYCYGMDIDFTKRIPSNAPERDHNNIVLQHMRKSKFIDLFW
jgi:hypothetical protein